MIKEEVFWKWFSENSSKYYFLNQIKDPSLKEKLLNNLLAHLQEYNENLFFEIGGKPNGIQELIISAGGNKKYFDLVEKLVAKAPNISNWEIKALKPAMGINFVTSYEGIEIDPKNIWFLPLENENYPHSIGLRICLLNYNAEHEELYLNASYQILDTILGEKSTALDIEHLEVGNLPLNPADEGLIKLSELPNYVTWKKGVLNQDNSSRH